MKRLIAATAIFILSALPAVNTMAVTQDNSFTFISTMGIFEDVYDFFKSSPAYLPGFEKSTLWTQMSNLQDTNERLLNTYGSWHPTVGSNATYQTSNHYLLGGQTGLLGLGRIGGMLDWLSQSTPQPVIDLNGENWSGFGESTRVVEEDQDADGQYDQRRTTYGRIEKITHSYENDVYVAYGLTVMPGLDFGAAVRAVWDRHQPTWNDWENDVSLDEIQQTRNYNLVNEQYLYTLDLTRSGSLDYGESTWQIVLGGRSKGLLGQLPALDLVVNAGVLLQQADNSYEYNYTRHEDRNPADANVYNHDAYYESGIEPGTGVYPGSGLGFLLNLRGDYTLNKNMIVTGMAGINAVPFTLADAKQDRITADDQQDWSGTGDLLRDRLDTTDTDAFSGTCNDSLFYASGRVQYLDKGWKLGLGIQASSSRTESDLSYKSTYRSEASHSGEFLPYDNTTATVTYAYEGNSKTVSAVNQLALPVGLVITVTDNFFIRLGAIHVIELQEETCSFELSSQSGRNRVVAHGDGSATQSADIIDGLIEYQQSTLAVRQYNLYQYGISWWPHPNLQIDLAGFEYLVYLGGYRVSATFHF
ncbi:hypothetical protein JW933_10165 [candidate division FCPU426 bacterium]|nr:hypothetical protein [candidate division FCPU426 bacterium]